jgi:hypothetical protein
MEREEPLKSLHLILSLSKDEAGIYAFFSILLEKEGGGLREKPWFGKSISGNTKAAR